MCVRIYCYPRLFYYNSQWTKSELSLCVAHIVVRHLLVGQCCDNQNQQKLSWKHNNSGHMNSTVVL